MPGVDIEVVRHATGNKTKTIRLTVAHILEYLRMKHVRFTSTRSIAEFSIYVRDGYTGEKFPIDNCNSIEIQYHEYKKS